MAKSFEQRIGATAARVVDGSRRHPGVVVALCALTTLGALVLAATSLEMDTDSERLLSADLPVRQTNLALAEAFPGNQNNLILMIEADDPHDARDAALALAETLRASPAQYPLVFLPGDDPYYDDFGLFYLDRDELEELAVRIEDAGPLLAALVDRPELPTFVGALSHVISDVDGLEGLGEDGVQILEEVTAAVDRTLVGERAPLDWDGLLFDDVGGEPDLPQLIFVRPAGDLAQMQPVTEALADLRALAAELPGAPGLRVRVTGDRAVHTEEMSLIVVEAAVAGGVSLLLVTAILFYALRSFRLMLATVITLLAGLGWTAGFAALSVGHLNALTSAFAVLYIGLGVDFGIHFAMSYLEQRSLGETLPGALRGAGLNAGSSLGLCALTTAIGFYAFIPTSYTAVADMGIISGSGVLLGLFATLTLFPALISLGLAEPTASGRRATRELDIRLPTFPVRYPRAVCAVSALVTLACCAALMRVQFDSNSLNVRDPRVESVQALRDLLSNEERSAWTIEVLASDLDEAREAAAALEALEGIDHVNTVESFLPDEQIERLALFEQMRADLTEPVELSDDERGEGRDRMQAVEYTIEGFAVALDIDAELRDGEGDDDPLVLAAERLRVALLTLLDRQSGADEAPDLDALEADLFDELPDALEGAVDALPTREVALADLPTDLRRRYLTPDGRARVEVFSARNLNEDGELDRFSDLVHSVRPDAAGAVAGTVALGRSIVASLQQALATAVVVIILLLLVLWRSLSYTVITLTPLFVGTVTTAAVSVLADIPLNFANIIVLPLILGIGVDSGIHLVHRHRSGLLGASNLLTTATARAVLFSALTTLVSFATLAFSNHLGIASLGQMLAAGIALMAIANVVVLPAILTLHGGQGREAARLPGDPVPVSEAERGPDQGHESAA